MQRHEETAFREFLRARIIFLRDVNNLSGEEMSEYLHVTPRSYYAQEAGEYGFSAQTLAFYLSYLSEDERTAFFCDFRRVMEKADIHMPPLQPGVPRRRKRGKRKKIAQLE